MKLKEAVIKAVQDSEICDTLFHGFDTRVILSSLEQSGFVIVPKEATKEMLLRGETAVEDNITETCDTNECYKIYDEMKLAGEAYRAMLDARPKLEDE